MGCKTRSSCLREFWDAHVAPRVAPEGSAPTLQALQSQIREPGASIAVDEDYVTRYQALADQAALISGAKDEVKRAVLAHGPAEAYVTPYGTFTYRADKRGRRSFRLTGDVKDNG